MTFPLPEGTCRIVCRPKRTPPRLTGIDEAIRMAKAAVKNGDNACDVARAVAAAVGCESGPCLEERAALDAGLEALREDLDETIQAFLDLVRVVAGDKPDFESIPGADKAASWGARMLAKLRELFRRVTIIFYIRDVVEALLTLWDKLRQLARTVSGITTDGNALLSCLAAQGE